MDKRVFTIAAQVLALLLVGGAGAWIHASRAEVKLYAEAKPAQPAGPVEPGAPDETPQGPITEIKVKDAAALLETSGAAFIDARDLEQYETSHISGAFLLPFSEFLSGDVPEVVDFLPRDLPIIVYCEGGDCHASHQVAEMLVDYGFNDLRVLADGWPAWEEGGYPLEEGPPPFGP